MSKAVVEVEVPAVAAARAGCAVLLGNGGRGFPDVRRSECELVHAHVFATLRCASVVISVFVKDIANLTQAGKLGEP
jgi:hypothetical protein